MGVSHETLPLPPSLSQHPSGHHQSQEAGEDGVGDHGGTELFGFWTNAKRRFKRKVGYESETGRLIRNGVPRPGGCLVVVLIGIGVLVIAAVAMAR